MAAQRKIAREMAREYLQRNDPLGWFEALYRAAEGDASIIPWADRVPNPNLMEWLETHPTPGTGKSALKVGCGLGDDAEALARQGYGVTAFDVSETAIAWCRKRFPQSPVAYEIADLFKAPLPWNRAFDLVLESYTLQVLPPELREQAIERISGFVAPGGSLLVICRGRDPEDDPGRMPWPLTRKELSFFTACGLEQESFDAFTDAEEPPVPRFRATYRRR